MCSQPAFYLLDQDIAKFPRIKSKHATSYLDIPAIVNVVKLLTKNGFPFYIMASYSCYSYEEIKCKNAKFKIVFVGIFFRS